MIKHAILSDRIKLRKLLVFPIYLRIACFINLLKDCVDFWKLVLEGKTENKSHDLTYEVETCQEASNHRFQFRENFVFDFAEIFLIFFFFKFIILAILVDFEKYCISLHTKIREKFVKKLRKRNSFLGGKKIVRKIVNFFLISRSYIP